MIDWLRETLAHLHSFPDLHNIFNDLTIIPNEGGSNAELAQKFRSGLFEWSDIMAFGLYLVKLLLELLGIAAIIQLMLAGYRYIMPTEDAKEKGKEGIKNTLIGFTLVVLAWAIVDVVIAFLTN